MAGLRTRDAVIQGLKATGGIITFAGLIMAGAFSLMLIQKQKQVARERLCLRFCHRVLRIWGFLMCSATLLDCFIVRPLLVPAVMLVMEKHNWWPATMPPTLQEIANQPGHQDCDHAELEELQPLH
jgi:RND superfamily putative drug exporter